jgi:hypothetical protein
MSMIVLNLICLSGHRFEGWFASNDAFDEQLAGHRISCPRCNSVEVSRLPSGPHVARRSAEPAAGVAEQTVDLLRTLVDGSEDVGRRFAEEARRIHFHEAPERRIRGLTTLDEIEELLDEGIPVLPLPIPPKDETH